jgi:hypothetical protein
MDELLEDFKGFCAYEGDGLEWLLEGLNFKEKTDELVRPKVLNLWPRNDWDVPQLAVGID